MLCRLYDTRNKRYIKADETMDYAVHPTGAVLHEGVEDHRIIVELSSGLEDKAGKEMFVGDTVLYGATRCTVGINDAAFCLFGAEDSYTLGYLSQKNLEVVGTIHDDEMEAE